MSEFDDYKNDLGPPGTVPALKPGTDPTALLLSAQEGFVLSRVDGVSSLRDICNMCGLGDGATLKLLKDLKSKGVIRSGRDPRVRIGRRRESNKARSRQRRGHDDLDRASLEEMRAWSSFLFDPDLVDESAKLSDVRKKRILYTYQRLGELTYYELLGVETDATNIEIRKAYYLLTKRFHPDRYFRQEIGLYRDHLTAIFKQLGTAWDVLSDRENRRKYDLLVVGSRGPSPKDVGAEERRKRAERVFEVGMSKFNAGIFDMALEDFVQARDLEPTNARYGDMIEHANREMARRKATDAYQHGLAAQKQGDMKTARDAFVEAAQAQASLEHLIEAAQAIAAVGGDVDRALQFAKVAVRMAADELRVHKTLAAVYERRNELSEARNAWGRAAEIQPDDEEVQAKLLTLGEGSHA